MEIQKAREIVSYKLGLKQGLAALEDPVLLKDVVEQAIRDKEDDDQKSIPLREYMDATKTVNKFRGEFARLDGEKWLLDLSAEDGVVTTDSGLRYRVLEKGEGQQCLEGATVRVHYEGKLKDGTVFDSSYNRGQPATFAQNAVIQGWQEGLTLMRVGACYQFYIPEYLAYGERGAGADIPPFAALFFEVELQAVF